MANHKSAQKRAKQNEIKRLRNKAVKTNTKSVIKQIRASASADAPEKMIENLNRAKSVIDKAAKKGVIHKRNAARKISRLTKLAGAH